jgi:RNA polymerase sigma factor (sigma-70 family)
MNLRSRKTVVEAFSSFIKINQENPYFYDGWITSPPLRHSIESQTQNDPEGNEDYWALVWLKKVLENPQQSLARGHLSAYLEEVCYWITVKDIKNILNIYNFDPVDCFQICRSVAAMPEIFKQYNSQLSKLKSYAKSHIQREVLEEIRQGLEEERFAKTGLLRHTKKTRFTKRLNRAGILEPEFSELLLAWQCFNNIYTEKTPRGSRTLPWPSEEKLAEIAESYNQLRSPNLKFIDRQNLNRMLDKCYQIIREYSSIKPFYTDSIEHFQEQYEWREMPININSGYKIWQDSDSKFNQQQEVNSLLSKTFEKLKSEDRKILQLSIGLKITQSDIAKLLGLSKQYQVSRKKDSAKATLLQALAPWSVKKFNIQLSSEQLNGISIQLEEWLEKHCTTAFNECLKTILIQSFSSDIPILVSWSVKPRDGKQLKPQVIAEKHKISESELEQKVEQIQQHLQEQLIVHLKKRLKVSLAPYPSASQKIATFVNTWLETAPYATFR